MCGQTIWFYMVNDTLSMDHINTLKKNVACFFLSFLTSVDTVLSYRGKTDSSFIEKKNDPDANSFFWGENKLATATNVAKSKHLRFSAAYKS